MMDDDGHDEPWTDGHRPHRCGYYIEEHDLVYTKTSDGRRIRQWQCPPQSIVSSAPVLG